MIPKLVIKFFIFIIIAAYLLTLFGSPTASYADGKSSKAKSDVDRWHPRNQGSSGLTTTAKVALIITGTVITVVFIAKLARGHDDGEKGRKQSDEQACIGDSSRVLLMQTKLRKNEQKTLTRLPKRTPLVPSED